MSDEQSKRRLQNLSNLGALLDNAIPIPGTQLRFGIDSLVGLIPGIGDSIGAIISSYIIYEAARAGVPIRGLLRMLWNVFLDWLLGLFPLLGDLVDMGFKANLRNVELYKHYYEKSLLRERTGERALTVIKIALALLVLFMAISTFFVVRLLFQVVVSN